MNKKLATILTMSVTILATLIVLYFSNSFSRSYWLSLSVVEKLNILDSTLTDYLEDNDHRISLDQRGAVLRKLESEIDEYENLSPWTEDDLDVIFLILSELNKYPTKYQTLPFLVAYNNYVTSEFIDRRDPILVDRSKLINLIDKNLIDTRNLLIIEDNFSNRITVKINIQGDYVFSFTDPSTEKDLVIVIPKSEINTAIDLLAVDFRDLKSTDFFTEKLN
jgi:hypothetical protein